MAISATIAAGVAGAGATILASNNASDAARSAADSQSAASAASIAENQRQFDLIRSDNAPQRQVSSASINALGGAFGLSGYGSTPAPSMTAPAAGPSAPAMRQPAPMTVGGGDPGVSMTGGLRDRAIGTGPGVTYAPKVGTTTPSMTGSTPIATTGAPDPTASADAYMAANPDVATRAQQAVASGEIGPNSQWKTPEDWAAYHYANTGKTEGRAWPAVSMTGATSPPSAGGYTPPPGYADPTAPNGYNAGARPTPSATPGFYKPGNLDVSLGAYQQSPDYNFRLGEGMKALDHTAASMGGVMSGARVLAAQRYGQNFATTDYNNWRDYTTNRYDTANSLGNTLAMEAVGQSNADRARSDGLYQDDRSFLTGQYNNRTGQLMTLAGFGQNANATNANAAASFASSDAALRGTAATAQGNGAIAGANAFTSGVNNLMTTGAYLGGQYMAANPGYGVNAPSSSVPWGSMTLPATPPASAFTFG